MRRREFISLFGSAAIWPATARAQSTDRLRRIGVLMNLAESDPESQARIAALRDGLRKLGWIEGANIQISTRWASADPERARVAAGELVAINSEVIVASTTIPLLALQRTTKTVPIVFTQIADPVGNGFVASLARPGNNITGFVQFEYEIATVWVEILKQLAPNLTRIAVLYDPANEREAQRFLPMIEITAQKYGLEVSPFKVGAPPDIERAIDAFARAPNGGLVLLPGPIMATQREFILSLAAKHHLPNVYSLRYYPENGGLVSYGPNNIEMHRSSADYIDRILKGENPADLPIQFPTKYQFVINLKAAKALGLEVPRTLLARADEVIE